jgi:putative acetyltransferase
LRRTGRNIHSVVIRLAVREDAPSIASVLRESFVEYRPHYTEEGYAATTPESDQIISRLGEGPVWVALCNDVVVGTVSAAPEGDALYIRGMAILPAARGQRIGEQLLGRVEGFASERGFRRLFLSTTPFLGRAIRLYESFGFKRSSEGLDNLFGTPLFTMEKFLDHTD